LTDHTIFIRAFFPYSSLSLLNIHVVLVVHEGAHVLAPSRKVARNLHLNQLSQPSHVLDFLLLEFQVRVEASNVESPLKALRELSASSREHHFIDGGAGGLGLIALVAVGNLLEHLFVARALKSSNKTVKILDVVETGREVRVKISDLAHVLFALVFATSCIATVAQRVGDDLNGLQVGLKVKKVAHHSFGAVVKLGLAELEELIEPDLADAELNLLKGVISHSLRDVLGVDLSAIVSLSSRGHLVQEFAEIHTDGKIN